MRRALTLLFIACLALHATAESVKPEKCRGVSATDCEVTDLQVTPCPEAASGEPCHLKKGKSANILFNMKPSFSGDAPLTRAYWSTMLMDLPFVGMSTDACKFTQCPLEAGRQQLYNYTLDIDKSFPSQRYNLKWKVWIEEEKEKKECCFMFKMRLS